MIKNVMESVVSNKLDELVNKVAVCSCAKCREDILAHALNKLHPKYVSTEEGELYSKLKTTYLDEENEVTVELLKAIEKVTKNPKHGTINN